jgi:hypothetical protein
MLTIKTRTTVETQEHMEVEITGAVLRKALGLPDDARIEFHVPGGADWANTAISIDEEPLLASWSRSRFDTDEAEHGKEGEK